MIGYELLLDSLHLVFPAYESIADCLERYLTALALQLHCELAAGSYSGRFSGGHLILGLVGLGINNTHDRMNGQRRIGRNNNKLVSCSSWYSEKTCKTS